MKNATPNDPQERRVLIVATSLNPGSKSSILARHAYEDARARGVEAEFVDLRKLALPFCTGTSQDDSFPDLERLKAAFKRSTHIVLAVPIYNGDVNAAARNLPNLGCDFSYKTVGFLAAAGGERSYMATFSFGNSLMFEFCTWIVPRHVYAVRSDFAEGEIQNPEIKERIERLIGDLIGHVQIPQAQLEGAAS